MDFVDERVQLLSEMEITTVKELIGKLYDVISWLTDNASNHVVPVTTAEKFLYLSIGVEWIDASGRHNAPQTIPESSDTPDDDPDVVYIVTDMEELPNDSHPRLANLPDKPQLVPQRVTSPSTFTADQQDKFMNLIRPYITPAAGVKVNAPSQETAAVHLENNLKSFGSTTHKSLTTWLADGGLYDVTTIQTPIKIDDGRTLVATKIGKLKLKLQLQIKQKKLC